MLVVFGIIVMLVVFGINCYVGSVWDKLLCW